MERYIGIDLGGTTMRVAIVSASGEIEQKISAATEADKGADVAIMRLAELVNQLDTNNEFAWIGLGMPGPIDVKNGCMLDAPNFPGWKGYPIVETLEKMVRKKVILENDANVASLGEAFCGNDTRNKSIIFMTVSTGVGGGIVMNGELVSGVHGYAGEFGCMIVSEENRQHPTLPAGSLESLCSGTALTKQAQEIYGKEYNVVDIFEKYKKENEQAQALIQQFVANIAKAIGTLQQVIDPETFVLGGSVILNNQWLCPMIESKAKKYVYTSLAPHIKVRAASLGSDAGLIGAAFLTRKKGV